MARWSRAARLLPGSAERVLDLGCAFGFGTRRLADGRWVVGIDVSEASIRRATSGPGAARFLIAAGDRLPFMDASFDAVTCLDVLEHVADERTVLAEAHRVLRPGGTLVVSVPHRGPLARYDSINLCPGFWEMREVAPGRDVSAIPEVHRHYSVAELRQILRPQFCIAGVWRTGIGVAELVNIPLLWLSKGMLRMPRLYDFLQYLYFTVYLADDVIPMGRQGYHLMVRATRVGDGRAAPC